MRLAEEFVRANGYTDAPATKPLDQLDGETLERFPREQWVAMRRGTLESRACAFQRGANRLHDEQGWTVLFYLKAPARTDRYRLEGCYLASAVEVDRRGEHLLVRHGSVPSYRDSPEFHGYTMRDTARPSAAPNTALERTPTGKGSVLTIDTANALQSSRTVPMARIAL